MKHSALKQSCKTLISGLTSLAISSSLILTPTLTFAGNTDNSTGAQESGANQLPSSLAPKPRILSTEYLAALLDVIGDDLEVVFDRGGAKITVDVKAHGDEIVIDLKEGDKPIPVRFGIDTEERYGTLIPMLIRANDLVEQTGRHLGAIYLHNDWATFHDLVEKSQDTYKKLPAPKGPFVEWFSKQEAPRQQLNKISSRISAFIGRSLARIEEAERSRQIDAELDAQWERHKRWSVWKDRIAAVVASVSLTSVVTGAGLMVLSPNSTVPGLDPAYGVVGGLAGLFFTSHRLFPEFFLGEDMSVVTQQLKFHLRQSFRNLKDRVTNALLSSRLRQNHVNSRQTPVNFGAVQLKFQTGTLFGFAEHTFTFPVVAQPDEMKNKPLSHQDHVREEYQAVKSATLDSLRAAQKTGFKALAPVMEYGFITHLQPGVHLRAILEGIQEFNSTSPNSNPVAITVALSEDTKSADIAKLTQIAEDAARNGIEPRESMRTADQRPSKPNRYSGAELAQTRACSAIFAR